MVTAPSLPPFVVTFVCDWNTCMLQGYADTATVIESVHPLAASVTVISTLPEAQLAGYPENVFPVELVIDPVAVVASEYVTT